MILPFRLCLLPSKAAYEHHPIVDKAFLLGHRRLLRIVFSLLFGFFTTRIPSPYSETIIQFFQAAFETMMKLTHFIMRFAPIGIFALVAKMVATTGFSPFIDLALYAITVLCGLLFHSLVTLPIILYFVGRRSPRGHSQAMAWPPTN